ncbi:hypothetical protein [Halomonas salipaludis]|nr:hypothetical protein [Halomonas salipaludis]
MSFTYNRLDKDDVALLMVDHQPGHLAAYANLMQSYNQQSQLG